MKRTAFRSILYVSVVALLSSCAESDSPTAGVAAGAPSGANVSSMPGNPATGSAGGEGAEGGGGGGVSATPPGGVAPPGGVTPPGGVATPPPPMANGGGSNASGGSGASGGSPPVASGGSNASNGGSMASALGGARASGGVGGTNASGGSIASGGTPVAPMAGAGPMLPVSSNTALPKHYHQTNGWGTKTEAGLGGKVIKVTNLNNSGPGSLAAALGESGDRLIVFEVGGVIDQDTQRLNIANGNVTVAGQTAPSPGITVIRADTNITGSDIVISHMAFRLGDDGGVVKAAGDTIDISGENIVLDHVAASWSVDECVTMVGAKNVTLYKTMVTEALSVSKHPEGEHSKGSLIQKGTDNVSMIGTLYAHNALRNPRLHSGAQVALINGVIYDWFPGADDEGDKRFHFVIHMNQAKMSIVGNVAIQGPESVGDTLVSGHKGGQAVAYMKDNIIVDPMGTPLKEHADNVTVLDTPPLWPEGVEVMPTDEALYEVLRTVGPRPGDRDPVTARTVRTVADGTGGIVHSQDDVGGYPAYPATMHTVTVPDGAAARRAWLDALADDIAVDRSIDLSRLYPLVGSEASDKLK